MKIKVLKDSDWENLLVDSNEEHHVCVLNMTVRVRKKDGISYICEYDKDYLLKFKPHDEVYKHIEV